MPTRKELANAIRFLSMDAVEKAKEAGIFVISTSIYQTYGFNMHGMARPPMADPNDFSSYLPGVFWKNEFYYW